YLKKEIEMYGYITSTVEDFDRVLEVCEKFFPQLVLLDINLPSFHFFYWCRHLRLMSTCPLIFISVRVGEMDQVMALEIGIDDFITNPFHPELVLAITRSEIKCGYVVYSVFR